MKGVKGMQLKGDQGGQGGNLPASRMSGTSRHLFAGSSLPSQTPGWQPSCDHRRIAKKPCGGKPFPASSSAAADSHEPGGDKGAHVRKMPKCRNNAKPAAASLEPGEVGSGGLLVDLQRTQQPQLHKWKGRKECQAPNCAQVRQGRGQGGAAQVMPGRRAELALLNVHRRGQERGHAMR